jgi:hypothetical protein
VNLSNQTQVRPLIYPSELQRLNKPGDIGNSIIVTFGNYPLKTFFSPSFKVSFYQMGKMDTGNLSERYFDENTILYNISDRNAIVFGELSENSTEETKEDEKENAKEETITFTPGPGVTAIIHGQNEEKKNASDDESDDAVVSDPAEQELVTLWRAYKEGFPEGTLNDFYKNFLAPNSEVQ